MNDIIPINPDDRDPRNSHVPVLPAPRLPGAGVTIRAAVLGDFPFIDELQKRHKKQVGFMWEAAIKGHIEKGNVLVAEATGAMVDGGCGMGDGDAAEGSEGVSSGCARTTGGTPIPPKATTGETPIPPQGSCPAPNTQSPTPIRVGYLIGVDRYLKRDELGIIYQMNVVPAYQRSLVAANLLKEKFERSAYGCRLYCCWCAQDLKANKFWEAMGFVPLAFRTGGGRPRNSNSKKTPRMHIFWQKRIRPRKFDSQTNSWVEDDFPYWFPSQTGAGAIGEDRLVLPIPPGTHWSDAKPVVLPEGTGSCEETLLLEERVDELTKAKKAARKGLRGEACGLEGKAKGKPKKLPGVKAVAAGGLHFGARQLTPAEEAVQQADAEAKRVADEAAAIDAALKEAKRAARKAKKKFDPAQEAFARELKDRWLEEVAARPGLLAASHARYEVTRGIQAKINDASERIDGERLEFCDAA